MMRHSMLPLVLLSPLVAGCLDAPMAPAHSTGQPTTGETGALASQAAGLAFIEEMTGHAAHACIDDYPIHLHWLEEPEWEPLRLAVESAVLRWSHIIAPTPVAPYVFQQTETCGVNGHENLVFAAGDTLAAGLHLYVFPGQWEPPVGTVSFGAPFGWAMECVPQSWEWTKDSLYLRPVDSQYNPIAETTPVGIIGLPAQRWTNKEERDIHELTPRKAYVTALHELGHVLGIGLGETWWNSVEIVRPAGTMDGFNDTWNETRYPGAFWTDSAAIKDLSGVLEEQGFPYDGNMIPLALNGYGWNPQTNDTTWNRPAHWDECLLGTQWVYYRETKQFRRPTGELMREGLGDMVDPRITATTLSALQGFKARSVSADYMVYGPSGQRFCRREKPDSTSPAPFVAQRRDGPRPIGTVVPGVAIDWLNQRRPTG